MMTPPAPKATATSTPPSTNTKHESRQHADLLGRVGFQSSSKTLLADENAQSNHLNLDESMPSPSSLVNAPLKFQSGLNDDTACLNRRTSCLQFHSKYDNILLSGHGIRSDGKIGEPQGTIGVWAFDQPESTSLQRTLISSAPITNLQLFSMSPTIVLGGTSIGSIHLWDLRVKTSLCISAFDKHSIDISDCHGRQSITSIRTTTTASPYFITTSINGHICKWSLSQMDGPISQSIAHDSNISDKVCVRAMDFPKSTRLSADDQKSTNRSPSLFIGTSHGAVCRLENDGNLWNVESERGVHNAAVTSVQSHPGGTYVPHLDDVIATSSFDWNVNVWYFRRGQECKQVWQHDNCANGAVYDVAWSSLHPTVLCYGDEAGVLSLNDLSGHLRNESNGTANWSFAAAIDKKRNSRRAAITKLRWSHNNRFICTGDKVGNISLWSTTSHLASLPDAEWLATFLKLKQTNVPK